MDERRKKLLLAGRLTAQKIREERGDPTPISLPAQRETSKPGSLMPPVRVEQAKVHGLSMPMIAWCPGKSPAQIQLGAVMLDPTQPLDHQTYLAALAFRLDAMATTLDKADVRDLERHLADLGLWSESVNVTPENFGSVLVMSNPPVWDRLGALLPLMNLREQKLVENSQARQELNEDAEDPLARLESWIGALARLP